MHAWLRHRNAQFYLVLVKSSHRRCGLHCAPETSLELLDQLALAFISTAAVLRGSPADIRTLRPGHHILRWACFYLLCEWPFLALSFFIKQFYQSALIGAFPLSFCKFLYYIIILVNVNFSVRKHGFFLLKMYICRLGREKFYAHGSFWGWHPWL